VQLYRQSHVVPVARSASGASGVGCQARAVSVVMGKQVAGLAVERLAKLGQAEKKGSRRHEVAPIRTTRPATGLLGVTGTGLLQTEGVARASVRTFSAEVFTLHRLFPEL
jgi:hypothetical protein